MVRRPRSIITRRRSALGYVTLLGWLTVPENVCNTSPTRSSMTSRVDSAAILCAGVVERGVVVGRGVNDVLLVTRGCSGPGMVRDRVPLHADRAMIAATAAMVPTRTR